MNKLYVANIIRFSPLLIMLLITTALGLGLFNKKTIDPIDKYHYGLTFPNFEIPSLKKDTVFSPKLFGNGQVAVINIFASWCVPCAQEHELLMKLASKVNIYGIAWKDKPEAVFNYLVDKGNPYQEIGIDEKGITTVPMAISGVPETYVLNKQGQIAFHYRAPLTQDFLDQLIIPLVEKLHNDEIIIH